ncbi:MAG: hypothetical protein M1819_003509 [Sarea resinae]|nr:MAG: hypothetical protein M1819_003509 [Sarea resinae]
MAGLEKEAPVDLHPEMAEYPTPVANSSGMPVDVQSPGGIQSQANNAPGYAAQQKSMEYNPPGDGVIGEADADWHYSLFDCFTPISTCCEAWWSPCTIFGRTQERLKDPKLEDYRPLKTRQVSAGFIFASPPSFCNASPAKRSGRDIASAESRIMTGSLCGAAAHAHSFNRRRRWHTGLAIRLKNDCPEDQAGGALSAIR